jgi:hypothetical protein
MDTARTRRSLVTVLAVVIHVLAVTCCAGSHDARRVSAKRLADAAPGSSEKGRSEFYASPDGRPDGDGSPQRPWDLATALAQPKAVRPGDTIWLRGGTYGGCFVSNLVGSESAPIIVRQYGGERAVIDAAGCDPRQTNAGRPEGKYRKSLTVKGADTWYWGFELMNSDPMRVTAGGGANPAGMTRGDGATVYGPGTKLINMVIHDAVDGVGFWEKAVDAEVYGCVIFNNGWLGPERGNGHGLYIQNEKGTKNVVDVISFNNFATGMKAYGKRGATVGVRFEGVISFNNGSPAGEEKRAENIFVGPDGPTPADRIEIVNNFLYHPPGVVANNLRVGYGTGKNQRVVVSGNYIAGGDQPLIIKDWNAGRVFGNTLYAGGSAARGRRSQLANLILAEGARASSFEWEENTYFSEAQGQKEAVLFSFSEEKLSFEGWRRASGFDKNSRYQAGRPAGTQVFVRPNRYEPGRANIIIYNWDRKESVEVDLSRVLRPGAKFEIRNVQDYLGAPLLVKRYDGRPVVIPMTDLRVAAPLGHPQSPRSTGPDFGVFVVLKFNDDAGAEKQNPGRRKR